ncbi:MAG: hypothetical protein J5552_00040 [Prevotella sp.]|nr:hypothetical protein [Prevotella sp.]
MKKTLLLLLSLLPWCVQAQEDTVDPNFYIYLCFGQSNMEGNAQPESVDRTGVDSRFQMLATCNFTNPRRTMGQWYTATPPIVSPWGGLGMADYFGRTMVAALPADVKVGVVDVAIGGIAIEGFMSDKIAGILASAESWQAERIRAYGSDPYQRLVDMGRIAQQKGVIKGVLLHQGCSNNGDPNWPNNVKKIYDKMLADLGLGADSVPLFAGETLRQEEGGSCYAHNTQVNRLPQVIPTAHVISSLGCPGNGQDPWHFSAVGYRIMGKRYALKALEVMGREQKADPDYQMPTNLKKFFAAKSISLGSYVEAIPGQRISPITATFEDNHKEEVSADVSFSSDVFTFDENGALAINQVGTGTAQAIYTDFTRQQTTASFDMKVTFFPLGQDFIQKIAGTLSYDESTHTLQMRPNSQAGWHYSKGADMSGYKFLVVKLKQEQTCDAQIRIFDKDNINGASYKDTINTRTLVSIPLQNMVYNKSGAKIDPAHIYYVVIRGFKVGELAIDDIFLSNDDAYDTGITDVERATMNDERYYDLQGRPINVNRLRKGLYIHNGRIIQQ